MVPHGSSWVGVPSWDLYVAGYLRRGVAFVGSGLPGPDCSCVVSLPSVGGGESLGR